MDTSWLDEKEAILSKEIAEDIRSLNPELRTEIIDAAVRIIRRELPDDPVGEKNNQLAVGHRERN